MKRPASKIVTVAVVAGVAIIAVAAARMILKDPDDAASGEAERCGAGFFRRGPRCCPTPEPMSKLGDGMCTTDLPKPTVECPAPLVMSPRGCDAPEHSVVLVPATSVLIGPSDWEAEGRVKPRTVKAGPFEMDRFEMSIGNARCKACPPEMERRLGGRDVARAASGLALSEAREICKSHGGRLPTEDEWIVAAAGTGPRRYPWGDTGAVCRRAAWGLTRGPCAIGATGPDTVGAHPDGATPLGIHDLAGNAAEWVETGVSCDDGGTGDEMPGRPDCLAVVRGGSYVTDLATDLRTWVRREVPASSRDVTIGFRCVYDVTGR